MRGMALLPIGGKTSSEKGKQSSLAFTQSRDNEDVNTDRGKLFSNFNFLKRLALTANSFRDINPQNSKVDKSMKRLLWDFTIPTDHGIHHRWLDISLHEKPNCKVLIIDTAVPSDGDFESKEREKKKKGK